MLADVEEVRRQARAVRSWADEARSRVARLQARCDATAWQSYAAEVFRDRLAAACAEHGRVAHDLDVAADALEAHANAVEQAGGR